MWRLLLSLKSGLLAESTWALDTLSILLFDDNTISYFHLQHLPGLLDALLDHFRACLLQIFGDIFGDLEIKTEGELKRLSLEGPTGDEAKPPEEGSEASISDLDTSPPDREKLDAPDNYTLKTRYGLSVKIEKDSPDSEVLFDDKPWDVHTHYASSAADWTSGRADRTDHVFTHLAPNDTLEFFKSRFFGRNRKHIPVRKDRVENVAKAACKAASVTCKKEGSEEETAKDSDNTDQPAPTLCAANCSSNGAGGEEDMRVDCDSNPPELDTKPDITDSSPPQNPSSCSNNSSSNTTTTTTSTSGVPTDSASNNNSSNCRDCLTNVQIKTEPPDPAAEEGENSSSSNSRSSSVNGVTATKDGELHNSLPASDAPSPANTTTNNPTPASSSASCSSSSSSSSKSSPLTTDNSSNPPTAPDAKPDLAPKAEVDEDEEMTTSKDDVVKEEPSDTSSTDGKKTPPLSDADAQSQDALTSGEVAREVAYRRHLEERAVNDAGQRLVERLRQEWEGGEEDKEAYHHDEPPLCLRVDSQEELSRRCICLSNIFRSLSFVPGNERKMSEHCGLMRVLGRLLLLHHWHPRRKREHHSFDREDTDNALEEPVDDGRAEWWWGALEELRENTLVIYANIAGKLSLSMYPESVCMPVLDGLLHWAVCSSAYAQDPLPTMTSSSVLSAQRLVLEALCKLCIQEENVDLLLSTPPFSRIVQLFYVLTQLLANRKEQVMREFAIVLLSSLVAGDQTAARVAALTHPAIPLLVDFLETSEHQALQVANSHGVEMLRESPEMMGTSLGMLRRAATTLLHLAKLPENRSLFLHQQQRLLQLVMSQILDQNVASILADVLYHCSQVS